MFYPNLCYLQLVSNAIQFLASVCERPHYKDLFSSQDILKSICQNVIVPNMMFRDADEELFEDNPEEYIRKDIEGSDIDTRRRAACDLVRGLCKYYEQVVTTIFSEYVNAMLRQYSQNPKENWKSKDAAIFVVTSLAAKKSTAKHGTTEANQLVNLVDFYNSQIVTDLNSPNVDEVPVLKADAIKYLITFRSLVRLCFREAILCQCFPLFHFFLVFCSNNRILEIAELKGNLGTKMANIYSELCYSLEMSQNLLENVFDGVFLIKTTSSLQLH